MTNTEQQLFLTSRRLPARLSAEQTAFLLGFQLHDISALVSTEMLKPLGKPAKNAPKYFASAEIMEHSTDKAWLSKATIKVSDHWAKKNAGRS